jgi:large subunit ribosomal protein L44e
MKFPAQIRTYCPFCKTHTDQKLTVVKQHERGALKAGQRRYLKIIKGYIGFPRPKVTPINQTKKTDIRLKCLKCNKMHTKTRTMKAKKVEFKR